MQELVATLIVLLSVAYVLRMWLPVFRTAKARPSIGEVGPQGAACRACNACRGCS